jgi:hypothetical protein
MVENIGTKKAILLIPLHHIYSRNKRSKSRRRSFEDFAVGFIV